ncbi:MAG TPA: S41 family peptidase [Blastocatellia bacterium]|nr:S41 family peptidase [Blastocatellia bacterium]
MRFKAKIAIVFFSTIIAFYSIVGGVMSSAGGAQVRSSYYTQIPIFEEVLGHIVRDYVDQPDLEKVRIGSLRGLAEGLDSYSAYLTPEQVKQYDPQSVKGETGLIIAKVSGFAYVIAVVKGSPGEQAGVREGDFVEYISKLPTRDLSLYEAQQLLSGQPGTSVELRVFRQGQSRKFTISRAKLAQPPIESRLEEPGIGYIKLTTLADGKTAEVRSHIAELVSKGAQKIVLDLRGSASGKLQEAAGVANLFTGSGVLARILGKNDREIQVFNADPAKVVFTGPLAVLTDRSTAGPAEAIAAAVIKDKRGDVVGDRTFGAGAEQQLFSLSDGGALLMTITRYAPATGKAFVEEGVAPTVKVERPVEAEALLPDTDEDDQDEEKPEQTPTVQPKSDVPATPAEDVQLKKALEILRQTATKAQAAKRAALRAPANTTKNIIDRKQVA